MQDLPFIFNYFQVFQQMKFFFGKKKIPSFPPVLRVKVWLTSKDQVCMSYDIQEHRQGTRLLLYRRNSVDIVTLLTDSVLLFSYC